MLMIEYRALSWWYWLVTACLLSAGVSGWPTGFHLAIGLTLCQLLHFTIRERRVDAFPVQVRFWYLMLLLVSLPEPMRLIYWIPTIGTWAQVIFGYCAMARLVSLLPWNRREPLSGGLLLKTFLSRPVRGNILQGLPPAGQMGATQTDPASFEALAAFCESERAMSVPIACEVVESRPEVCELRYSLRPERGPFAASRAGGSTV